MAAPRTDARGSMGSSMASGAVVHIEGMAELQRALRELSAMGTAAVTAIIGTDIVNPPYPFFLEYGTSRMPAYPSARPAYDEMGDTAIRTTADILAQLIIGGRRGQDVIETGAREGARPIENRWKELARYRTGQYRDSIHTNVERGIS